MRRACCDVHLGPKEYQNLHSEYLPGIFDLGPQASGNTLRASGLVVMTSRLQRGGRRFNSGLAHHLF